MHSLSAVTSLLPWLPVRVLKPTQSQSDVRSSTFACCCVHELQPIRLLLSMRTCRTPGWCSTRAAIINWPRLPLVVGHQFSSCSHKQQAQNSCTHLATLSPQNRLHHTRIHLLTQHPETKHPCCLWRNSHTILYTQTHLHWDSHAHQATGIIYN